MGADQVLGGVRSSVATRSRGGQVRFADMEQQWGTMSRAAGLKKALFLASLAAAIGYYVLLAVLVIIR